MKNFLHFTPLLDRNVYFIIRRFNHFLINDDNLEIACYVGSFGLTKWMIDKNHDLKKNCGFYGACRGGHKDLVLFMIDIGADWYDWGLKGACRGGHKELVMLMIEKGPKDWNLGLYGTCHGGHEEITTLMIKKGAKDLGGGIMCAYNSGHQDIITLLIKMGGHKLWIT